jgi:hypothetical protein
MVLRILCEGPYKYLGEHWNVFDATVVLTGLVSVCHALVQTVL